MQIPKGYDIREAQANDAEEIAFVHWDSWKTSYKGIIEQSYLDSVTFDDRLKLREKILSENSGLHLIATYNNKVIAFYDAGPFIVHSNQIISEPALFQRNCNGEVYALYILKEHQGLGIGKSLFQMGKSKLKNMGFSPFIAWVLNDNVSAIKFYEKMGGVLVDQIQVKLGDKKYIERAYQFNE